MSQNDRSLPNFLYCSSKKVSQNYIKYGEKEAKEDHLVQPTC